MNQFSLCHHVEEREYGPQPPTDAFSSLVFPSRSLWLCTQSRDEKLWFLYTGGKRSAVSRSTRCHERGALSDSGQKHAMALHRLFRRYTVCMVGSKNGWSVWLHLRCRHDHDNIGTRFELKDRPRQKSRNATLSYKRQ